MTDRIASLERDVAAALGTRVARAVADRGELTVEVAAADLREAARILRDDGALAFTTLVDLCANDYEGFADAPRQGPRFAVLFSQKVVVRDVPVPPVPRECRSLGCLLEKVLDSAPKLAVRDHGRQPC